MNISKFILAGIAGGILIFLLGYLTYGLLLADFFTKHAGPAKGAGRDMQQLLFLYLFIGNLLFGFLLAYVISKSGITTIGKGFICGATVGFLANAANGCITFATTWLISRTALAADAVSFAVVSGIVGAAQAWIAGKGKKA
ncbi:MAG TPA: hypothetical protein VMT76_15855 [Puia sp.]|nr:hypothetical protein [Puia sp.]